MQLIISRADFPVLVEALRRSQVSIEAELREEKKYTGQKSRDKVVELEEQRKSNMALYSCFANEWIIQSGTNL